MDKGLLTFLAIGLVAIYMVTNLIDDIQDDGEKELGSYKKENQYNGVNIVGDAILDVQHIDEKKQLEVWHSSEFKNEFMELFPNFDGMKRYVDSKIKGDALQKKLISTIDSIEIKFISGTLNGESSKAKLESLE
ncbi:MAG TPA: hypothetical protein EYM49_02525 [Campylobacterales bacterium]|nr:hypothetical protein [Campylobacterales bacterium]